MGHLRWNEFLGEFTHFWVNSRGVCLVERRTVMTGRSFDSKTDMVFPVHRIP